MEKIKLWGNVTPGNSPKRKEDVMELKHRKKPSHLLDMLGWLRALRSKKLGKNSKQAVDTYTHVWVRAADLDYRDTFEDEPYLIPYIAPGSRQAVIVVPGGGYCMKSMENEGTQIAEHLQKHGITAFVLWYRSNPYYQPYPLMDMQRAVRYVRFHAGEYGYDEDQIGAIGFSAGGAQVSLFMNVVRGGLITLPEYEKDAIDSVSDALNFGGLVYPALSYHHNRAMLYASFPAEEVRDANRQQAFVDTYDAVAHMNAAGIPHFICYGTKDTMVSLDRIREYIAVLRMTDTPYKETIIQGAGHGYGASVDNEKYAYWLGEFTTWLKTL